jgi:hypothetical protein
VSEIEDRAVVLRRRPLPGRLRYAARQLDGVCAQDSAGQARLIAVGALLDQAATETEQLEQQAAHEAPPVLRHCLVPGCLREFDVMATMGGTPLARESWSGVGWKAVRGTGVHPAGGHICPVHVELVTAHLPSPVVPAAPGRIDVRCACGEWASTGRRWHGAARGLWEEHLIEAGHLIEIDENGRSAWRGDGQ